MDLNLLEVGRTNEYVHSDEEIRVIRQSLREAEEELQRVVDYALPHRQDALRERVDRYRVATAPHKKLPEHIWRSIFRWYVPLDAPVIPGPDARPWLTLTRVCRTWRQIALERSGMWSGISFVVRHDYMRGLQIAREWFERAGTFPRYLKLRRAAILHADGWADDIMRLLIIPYQYGQLSLALPFRHIQQIFALMDSALGSLKTLALSVDTQYPSPDEEEWPAMFFPSTRLPNLRYLTITGAWDARHVASVLSMSGNTLRQLHLDYIKISISSFLFILRQCPLLEYCFLSINGTEEQPYVSIPCISLPCLRDLYLNFSAGNAADVAFSVLITPKLHVLDIKPLLPSSPPLEFHSSTLTEFLQRSKPQTLTSLSMGYSLFPYYIGEWLCHVPAIQSLRLRGQVVLDDRSAGEVAASKVASILQCLIIYDPTPRSDVEKILRMVELRNRKARTSKNCEAIRTIKIHSSSMLDNELLDLMRTLSLMGVNVTVWSVGW
ncbi:hypothetical protein AX15_005447 [Amanita polypyramis BW_CC]|nr:hypothetical protein AX15_005447 [Amanita polypyramis BW_CC]